MCVAKCDAYDVFQLEHELRVSQEKSAVMCDDRSKFEESVKVVQQSNSMAQAQLSQLQVLYCKRATYSRLTLNRHYSMSPSFAMQVATVVFTYFYQSN